MNLIASADANWGIGSNGQLLVRIPQDMQFFRRMTIGKAAVMGRKTRESIPGGILEGRVNIVLTRDREYQADGAILLHSLEELHQELGQYATEDIFVIGGESIYRQLLDECDTAYITKIDSAYSADAYFPDLDGRAEWKLTACSGEQDHCGIHYRYQKYERAKLEV